MEANSIFEPSAKVFESEKMYQNQNHKVLKSEELGLKPKPMEPIKTNFNIKTKTKCCFKKKRTSQN
jgi:hypothetical protein